MGSDKDLVVGLQLTHSGRFCKPNSQTRMEPRILYRHPILDRKFHLTDDVHVFSDGEIRTLIDDYIIAAVTTMETAGVLGAGRAAQVLANHATVPVSARQPR